MITLTFILRNQNKKSKRPTQAKKKGNNKDHSRDNEVKKISKTKSEAFVKIHKLDKYSARLTEKKRRLILLKLVMKEGTFLMTLKK